MKQIPEAFSPHEDLLKDKIILVTGATGGFGKAISLSCAEHGASVILLAKNIRLAEALYDEIEKCRVPKTGYLSDEPGRRDRTRLPGTGAKH